MKLSAFRIAQKRKHRHFCSAARTAIRNCQERPAFWPVANPVNDRHNDGKRDAGLVLLDDQQNEETTINKTRKRCEQHIESTKRRTTSPATPVGETTTSSSSPPKTASLAGASSTKVLVLPVSVLQSSVSRRGWSDRTRFSTNEFMRSFSQRRGPRRAVSLRKRLARSKTLCSMRRQNCSVCPATSCSA